MQEYAEPYDLETQLAPRASLNNSKPIMNFRNFY